MNGWTTRFLKSTRGKVVQLLRRKTASVSELANDLDLTDNAVRAHLVSLERDGLIEQTGKRSTIRKPESLYSLSSSAEALFPKSYHALLNTIMDVLDEDHSVDEVRTLLRKVGQKMVSDHVEEIADEDLGSRVNKAVELLGEIGGLAEISETEEGFRIAGFSCPFGSSVCHNRDVCRVIESMIATLTGEQVEEHCDRSTARPKCNFTVARSTTSHPVKAS